VSLFKRRSTEEVIAAQQEKEQRRRQKEQRKQEQEAARREYEELLVKAAGIASAKIICHKDTWKFAHNWAMGRTSYTPPSSADIIQQTEGMIEISVSGPNLVTLLIVTADMTGAPYVGHRAIASRVYAAIAEVVSTVDPNLKGGMPVPPIIIDAVPSASEDDQ